MEICLQLSPKDCKMGTSPSVLTRTASILQAAWSFLSHFKGGLQSSSGCGLEHLETMLVFCSSHYRIRLGPSKERGFRGTWLEFGQEKIFVTLKKNASGTLIGNFILNFNTAKIIC